MFSATFPQQQPSHSQASTICFLFFFFFPLPESFNNPGLFVNISSRTIKHFWIKCHVVEGASDLISPNVVHTSFGLYGDLWFSIDLQNTVLFFLFVFLHKKRALFPCACVRFILIFCSCLLTLHLFCLCSWTVVFFPLRMFRYTLARSGFGVLAFRRAYVLTRFAHSAPKNEYRPIKKVMVANRGKTAFLFFLFFLHTSYNFPLKKTSNWKHC